MTFLPATLTGSFGGPGWARAASSMPQLQKAIPAAAPLKKFLRVVIGSLPCGRRSGTGVFQFLSRYIAKTGKIEQSCFIKDCSRLSGNVTESAREKPVMRLLKSFVAMVALLVGSGAMAQSGYPDHQIRMIVPLAAGSAVDVAARIVTQKMSENMGQQIVIINQPGAAGLIGADQVAKAAPDGYTIGGFNDSVMTMVPNL